VEALNVINVTVLDAMPLIQMLVIHFVYFDIESFSDQRRRQSIAAFSVGIILWGIAFLTPLDFIFARTRNKNIEPDGSEQYSFNALYSLGSTGTSVNHSTGFVPGSDRLKEIDDIRVCDESKILRPKFYIPILPCKHLSIEWAQMVLAKFDISASGPNLGCRLRGMDLLAVRLDYGNILQYCIHLASH
jgi:hypothetical protein